MSRSVAQRALQSSWILIAVLAIILTSCSGNGDIDGPVLTSPRSPLTGGGGFDAQIGGVLSYDENTGCLLLSNNPVIWPHGASWQADPPAVKLQGQTIEPDMSVLGSGGYHKYELIKESVGVIVADAAQACVGPTGEIAKFNHGTDVELVANHGAIDGPVLTSPNPLSSGSTYLEAEVKGTILFDEATQSIFLEHSEIKSVHYPIIWPAGASWQESPPAIKLQGQTIEPGMSVYGGGGYHQYELIKESVGAAVADAAQACVGPTGEIAKFNHGSDVDLVTD